MKRRDFLKLAGIATLHVPFMVRGLSDISIAGSALGLDFSGVPEEWILSVDEDLLHEAIAVKGVYPGNGKPYATVAVDVEKMWSSITVTDAQGIAYHTTDGELWRNENGEVLLGEPT